MDTKPVVYKPRQPEKTVLYETIRIHYLSFLAELDAADRTLPRFIEREFEKFLSCGILSRGFLRLRCGSCGHDRLLAFSCKCRGWCGSCIARRMADTAAYLCDQVIPNVPMRTWTLTLPYPLRYLVAYNAEVLGDVVGAFNEALLGWLRRRAKDELDLSSIRQAHPGAITWIQRFNSACGLSPHLHVLATEGAFIESVSGDVTWRTLPSPTAHDVAEIAWDTCLRVKRLLERRGLIDADGEGNTNELAEREPLLAACYAASIKGFVVTGGRAGGRVIRIGAPNTTTPSQGPTHGFNLFAGRCIPAYDKSKREQVIGYMARPPISEKQLTVTEGGDIVLRLKRAWSDGTSHLKLTGTELIERLVSLVPSPRVNIVRYYGVFAPNARLRSTIVPKQSENADADDGGQRKNGRYLDWAALMRRVFEMDLTRCPQCGCQGMQRIASITQIEVIERILKCVGQPTAPPELEPARYPKQADLDSAAA